ncbi:glycosyltransferase family 4 protein [Caldicellulosiruptor morganii]|uniref:Glycosyltransferase family 4 protein n=1 Tax=Caldicellulosiruptor morganii TaxID=1387555 RepID=A0ABY7BLC5_9FIRM|nr:glycosyltransferase family 4 protein [Caldicellulosiruptor morganii]WAM33625.1 glycosyltransferase family 4 protein [Caldicellulosiruptor morganii]
MNILLSAYACEPNKGSEPGFGWNWACHLSQRGHKVIVLTSERYRTSIIAEVELHREKYKNLYFIYVKEPPLEKIFGKNEITIRLRYIMWQYKAFKLVKKLKLENEVDIIHHVTWGSLQMGSLLWKLNKPFVFGPVGGGQTSSKKFKKYYGIKWYIEILRDFYTKYFFRFFSTSKAASKSDLILVTNEETQKLAQKMKAKNTKLMLDSALKEEFIPEQFIVRSSGLHNKKTTVLWVGRLLKRKGVGLLIDVAKKIKGKNIEIVVVGDGEEKKLIENELQKDNNLPIKLIGHVKWQEIAKWYSKADIFAFTSLRDSFGMQLLEAMAFGLPIICLNQHGARNFVPDNAAIKIEVENKSLDEIIEEFASSIMILAENYELRIKLGQNGYRFALENTWNKRAEEIEKYYYSIIYNKNLQNSVVN